MNATIKDVAKAAGVSVATVSRVLNGSAAVSPEAAQQVNKAIEELGYSPNFLGRNLRKCGTNIILAIIPSTETTYYSEIIHGMQIAALEKGYDTVVCTTYSDFEIETRMLSMLQCRTADAAVLLGTRLDAEALNKMNEKYYIALCCERVENADVLTVTVDDRAGAYIAVKHLLSLGHKRIAIVSTSGSALSSKDREQGYREALRDSGIEVSEEYIWRGGYGSEDGEKAYKKFMALPEPPTAIFCISDLLAAGTLRCAELSGKKIGEDISVCGYDNTILSRLYTKGITTISQPCYEMGRTVMSELISNINNGSRKSRRIILDHELVVRESTGKPKG